MTRQPLNNRTQKADSHGWETPVRLRSIGTKIDWMVLAALALLSLSSGILMHSRLEAGMEAESIAAVRRENALALAIVEHHPPGAW